MGLEYRKIETEEKFKELVEEFYFLVDSEIKKVEAQIQMKDNNGIIFSIPKIISLINTIGYLRGQDNAFIDARPSTNFQSELYKNEDMFEKRLKIIIEYIAKEENEAYTSRLKEYFIKNRTYIQEGGL